MGESAEDGGSHNQSRVQAAGAFTPAQIAAIRVRAAERGYFTPTALARAVGVKHPTVMRWYSGERAPSVRTQKALAAALDWPWPTDFLGPATPVDAGHMDASAGTPAERGVLSSRGGGRRDVPVYRAGSRADPLAPGARGAAEDEVALLEADERVLGPRGFGIRVVDESLSHWTVARGDVLWFDPDWPAGGLASAPEEGVIVAALLLPHRAAHVQHRPLSLLPSGCV